MAETTEPLVLDLTSVGRDDVARVGGKNASLGEMLRHLGERGVNVPDGFATTAEAYRLFVRVNGLEEIIRSALDDLEAGRAELSDVGRRIREAMLRGEWPEALADAIVAAYRGLGERVGRTEIDVAVRSSATAEDLPEASFAGQQE
ncbi:MAG: phosphoenolpyruvate synthase, partial [Gammaproteobacteria bacterium]